MTALVGLDFHSMILEEEKLEVGIEEREEKKKWGARDEKVAEEVVACY